MSKWWTSTGRWHLVRDCAASGGHERGASPIELDFSDDYRPLTYLRNDGAASLRMALKIVEQAHHAHAIAESRDQEATA